MSSGGILLATDRVLSTGSHVEIEMDWPVEREEGVSPRLLIMGQIVRSEKGSVVQVGVKMLRYAFHTESR